MRASRLILLLGLLLFVSAPAAQADFGFSEVGVQFRNNSGEATYGAGEHPDSVNTVLNMNTYVDEADLLIPDGEAKNLVIDMPAGFAGNPLAVPRCSLADFSTRVEGRPMCPDATAVGRTAVKLEFHPIPADTDGYLHVPVYSLEPPPGSPAKLGFVALGVPLTIDVGVRQAPPYNVFAKVNAIPQVTKFYASETILWGNPASSTHDALRGNCLDMLPGRLDQPPSLGKCPVSLNEVAFLTAPRSCDGPLASDFWALAWNTGAEDRKPGETLAREGCGGLSFRPNPVASLSTDRAESPTGLAFDLSIEDEGIFSPSGRAHSDIKKAVVALPAGMTVNPSQAEGLATCTPAQYQQESLSSTGCPGASKIGSVEVETPLLKGTILRGSVYVAQQDDPKTPQPGAENPFDSLLAIYVTIKNPQLGVNVGMAGRVEPVESGPNVGQIITTFKDLPQLPVSSFKLRFREGGRSALVSPPTCGSFPVKATFTPWAQPAPDHTVITPLEISKGVNGGPCPAAGNRPFSPGFDAGTINNEAASYSPFAMRITRADGEQDLTRFSSGLPSGLLGKLAGVERCNQASVEAAKGRTGRDERATPSCPSNSKIGSVLAGAGVGNQLTYVPGTAYLAGPYKGAPLSVAVITPAVAGPFDVGTVVVQVGLDVDRVSGRASTDGSKSDPIPHMLAGIPLKLRDLRVDIDRPQFILNPTNCRPGAVTARFGGAGQDPYSPADDAIADASARFQAANCPSLAFKPALTMQLKGGTKRGAHPAFQTVLRARPGDANIAKTVVSLPHSAFLAQAHIRTVCTRVQFAANSCPAGSIYGFASAKSPLLDEVVSGPVYLRSSSNTLPDMVFVLKGLVEVNVTARIDSEKGRIRASLESIPDVPVSWFKLRMQGGKKGLIENSRNLCLHRSRAVVKMRGQNGRPHNFRPVLRPTRCKR